MSNAVNDNTVWDNSNIYSSLDDSKIEQDLESVIKKTDELESISKEILPALEDLENKANSLIGTVQNFVKEEHALSIQLRTIATFARCITSTNAKDEKAVALLSRVSKISTNLRKASTPIEIFIDRISESQLKELINHEELKAWEFQFRYGREMSDFQLNNSE